MPEEPRYDKQDLVVKRDGDGTVGFILTEQPARHAGEYWYGVQFGARRENCRESDLRPHQSGDDLAALLSSDAYGGPDAFRRHVTAVRLCGRLTDTLYSYGASKTTLYPYQFIPLLKYLSSPYRRLLIADEVGLGKTIEAGYVLQEELARGHLSRVLIVCPASLRRKWRDEMFNRFNHRFDLLNAAEARERIPLGDQERRTANPLRAIVSLQSIRNDRFIETVPATNAPVDLLIVDEAHHCRNPLAKQSRAVSALIDQADAVLFLSATPIQTSEMNLFALLHLLVPEEFPSEVGFKQRLEWNEPIVRAASLVRRPGSERLAEAAAAVREVAARGLAQTGLCDELLQLLENDGEDTPARRVELQQRLNELNLLSNVFTRTKRKDVHLNVAQRQAVVPVAALSDYEQSVYDAISNFIFEEYQRRHGDGAAQLVLVTYQRQIASSLPAAVRKFRDAIGGMESTWDDEMETPEEDIQSDSEDEARYRPAADPAFQRLIGEVDIVRLEREDTKYDLLTTAVRQQHQLAASGERRSRKLIVFSYFRRSLDYLERRLDEDGFRFVRIDGRVKSTPDSPDTDERGRRIDSFRFDPAIDVLLTSEVSSEGIDLQFCDTIVNWDLPWNPMVVEQRIGRIDRIGQESPKIFITNIASQGTIEARILQRLYTRIGIFEHSIGELEPILGDIVRELEDHLFRPHLTAEQQEHALHARELAIETQRTTQQALEDQAELLIGHDEFFHNQLDDIRRLGRYVGGDELRLFVTNELRSAIPGVDLIPTEEDGVYRLPYRHALGTFIDQMLPRGDEESMRFVDRLRSGKDRVTFDGELADRYPQVDPLHANHPLVRALAGRLEQDIGSHPQVACVRLASELVRPGPRFFAWSLVNESGFLQARSLMSVVIDLTGTEMTLLDDDTADHLLAEMIRHGEPWAAFSAPLYTDAEQCLHLAHEHMMGRVHGLDRRRRQRVEGIKQARHATIEATFDLRIQRQRERTGDMERRATAGDEGAARILGAFRARLGRMESDRELQLERIEALPLGTVSYEMLGAGFVDIVLRKGVST